MVNEISTYRRGIGHYASLALGLIVAVVTGAMILGAPVFSDGLSSPVDATTGNDLPRFAVGKPYLTRPAVEDGGTKEDQGL
jgi:hypothetical protein